MSELKFIDLFAGAGGLSAGLQNAGFEALYANEIINTYANTYSLNHPNTIVETKDIRLINAKKVRNKLKLKKGELTLLAGGPPCQGFSINAPKRDKSDFRNHLFIEFIRFVKEFEPQVVLIENVPGLVSFEQGSTLHSILKELEKAGYNADVRILYAPHFGVPQMRWRTFIIGMKSKHNISLACPSPNHSAPLRVNFTSRFDGRNIISLPEKINLHNFVSVKDAIDDLPKLSNGETGKALKEYRRKPQNDFQSIIRTGSFGVLNHEAPKLSIINLKRLSYIPIGGNWTNIPLNLLPKGMQKARKSDHTKRYGRVDPNGFASTILTKCDPHWGAYFHYSQDRIFTVREAARLQTFPDVYKFFGSRVEQYEQVGNAVPPFLAAAIGNSIISSLNNRSKSLFNLNLAI